MPLSVSYVIRDGEHILREIKDLPVTSEALGVLVSYFKNSVQVAIYQQKRELQETK